MRRPNENVSDGDFYAPQPSAEPLLSARSARLEPRGFDGRRYRPVLASESKKWRANP
ncbi:hypothetical protein ACFFQF_12925 [Haladaptatus pallidirubidus]|uniref:hypothetical protein n=1 Tax=Haladaptatus pallidirubidus TaxID=1008152 RepID=UPI0035EF7121